MKRLQVWLFLCGFVGLTGFFGVTHVIGAGFPVTETRELSPFEELHLSIGADVTVTQGDKYLCTITADTELVPMIATECRDGALHISVKESFSFTGRILISIEAPVIARVDIKGSGDVVLDHVTRENLTLVINGSGDIKASGTATNLTATINGSGDIRAEMLKVENAKAIINGNGDIHLHVTNQLSAEVRGSGDIRYAGSPEIKRSVVRGSGSIRDAN
jgi:hypothetical protein